MNTNLDTELSSIENLQWLPWVGQNYLTNENGNKLLFIGESHFYVPEEKGSFEKHLETTFTRTVINKVAIGKEYKTYENRAARIFPNLHFTFLNSDNIKSDTFWNKVAYYNLIQTPMKKVGTRPIAPNQGQILTGWKVFENVINTLKPDTCIFLGNSASKHFPKKFHSDTKIVLAPTNDKKINNAVPKKAELLINNEHQVRLFFIKHPSSYFSYELWNKYLTRNVPDLMSFLKATN